MKKYLLLFFITLSISVQAQTYMQVLRKANAAYQSKNYLEAASIYVSGNELAEFKAVKAKGSYDAACCFALGGDTSNAFKYLNEAIQNGYSHTSDIANDADLLALHGSTQWKRLLAIKRPATSTNDPLKARLITSDIDNFWDAYDRAQKDTANRSAIYKNYYLAKGSPGLQDYFASKIHSVRNFIPGHDRHPKFYAAIRNNTFKVNQQKKQMQASFIKFKGLYPAAQFPDVYFVIGTFTSAGTSSDHGLIIGLDQAVRTADIPTAELNLWENNNFTQLNELPNLVAHELIHFQQQNLAPDTTLLKAVLVEGMADFLAELISGKTPNERLHSFVKGHEQQVWADFEKEMYLNRADNWIGNSGQETPEHPADLGYWVGYQICRSYYEQSADKKQAVYDMLHITNYRDFYTRSKVQDLRFNQLTLNHLSSILALIINKSF